MTKELDDKTKALKIENDQLVRTRAKNLFKILKFIIYLYYFILKNVLSIISCAIVEQKAKAPSGGEGEQNIHKVLARRHAKDISEYTKQIHAKDREVTELKKKVAKVRREREREREREIVMPHRFLW